MSSCQLLSKTSFDVRYRLTNPEKLDITHSIPRNVLVFANFLEDSLLFENYTFYFANREGGSG